MGVIKYRPEFCQQLIDHMAQGMSYASFGAKVNCGRQTMYDWEKEYPEWKEAKETAQVAAQAWFETRLISIISGRKYTKDEADKMKFDPSLVNTSGLIFALKTRFHQDYGERNKQEVLLEGSPSFTIVPYKGDKDGDEDEA